MNRNLTSFMNKAAAMIVEPFKNSSETQVDQDNRFSPYLQFVKPLIDVTKRAQIHNLVVNDPLFLIEISKIFEFKSEHYGDYSTTELFENVDTKSWYDEVFGFYLSQRKSEQNKLLSSMAHFRLAVLSGLHSKGYETSKINDFQLEVSLGSSKAVVQLPKTESFSGYFDYGWDIQSAKKLTSLKQSLDCDAAIYLSPGKTDVSIREYCQKFDIFTMSGWDMVQFLIETDSMKHINKIS